MEIFSSPNRSKEDIYNCYKWASVPKVSRALNRKSLFWQNIVVRTNCEQSPKRNPSSSERLKCLRGGGFNLRYLFMNFDFSEVCQLGKSTTVYSDTRRHVTSKSAYTACFGWWQS
jgi:hypothetical protein